MRRRSNAGASALELGLFGPVLVLIVLFVFEAGMQASISAALDFAARRASRLGITGTVTANGAVATNAERQAAVRAAVLQAAGGLLLDARLTLDEASFGNFAQAEAGKGAAAGPGGAGQVVRYTLTYVQPLLTGSLAARLLARTDFVHTSSVVVVNELFPAK